MMRQRSTLLRTVAERVAEALPPEVEDVVLTGSVSRGVADDLSDVELLVVSNELPDALPLDDLHSWSPGVEGAHWFGGAFGAEFVELIWWTAAYAEARVEGIARGEFVDHPRLRTAEAILNGVPLRGDRHVRWTARLSSYPDGLAVAIVEDVVPFWLDPLRSYRSVLREGDALMLARRLAEDAEGILRVVFALNAEWEPGWKRIAQRVEPLAVKPDRLAERLDRAIRALDLAAMRSLAAETLALAPETPRTAKARRLLEEPL